MSLCLWCRSASGVARLSASGVVSGASGGVAAWCLWCLCVSSATGAAVACCGVAGVSGVLMTHTCTVVSGTPQVVSACYLELVPPVSNGMG